MTVEVLVQLVMSLGVLPALFVWLLLYTMKEHKADKEKAEQRERELLDHIKKSDDTQREITNSITKISDNMLKMQIDIEKLKHKEDLFYESTRIYQ